jgi:para-nitrobenzyl esterase
MPAPFLQGGPAMTSIRTLLVLILPLATLGAARAGSPCDPADAGSLCVAVSDDAGRPLGTVRGFSWNDQEQWRGIPFAAPPVGHLRWRPPESPAAWGGTRDASSFGSACVQWGGGDEDCLFLNVFRPVGTAASAQLPVIVHLHGGSNAVGSAEEDARSLVQHGVVVVTLNYRLFRFGFFAHPLLTAEGGGASGNYGLMDQIAALRWVQANIAGFGGDPGRVTLAGWSAGAHDAAAIMVSPLARGRGLFHRVVIQSPSYQDLYTLGGDLAAGEDLGARIAERVGCSSAPDVLDCLRRVSPADFLDLTGDLELPLMADGAVLPKPILELAAEVAGDGHDVPLLIGNTREEEGWFRLALADDGFAAEDFNRAAYVNETQNHFGPFAEKVRQEYPTEEYDDLLSAFIAVKSDAFGICPTREVARASGGSTYRYLYTKVLDDFPVVGSAHWVDQVLLWAYPWYPMTPGEAIVADRLQRYLTNFARTGDPNDPTDPELAAWPLFAAGDEQILTIDDTLSTMQGYHDGACDVLRGKLLDARCLSGCRRATAWFELSKRFAEKTLQVIRSGMGRQGR